MRTQIAHGLASVLLVVSLGAAQGPTNSGSKDTQSTTSRNAVAESKSGSRAKTSHHHPYQIGTASWYGDYFQGRPTASGEPYNMYDLTAAHPTLPLGSFVRVTNLRNGRAGGGEWCALTTAGRWFRDDLSTCRTTLRGCSSSSLRACSGCVWTW